MTRPSSDCHWRRAAQRNGGRRVAIMWKITNVKPIFESSRQSRGWNRISTRYLRAGKHFVTGRRQCSQRGLPRPNPRRRFARRANRRSPVRGKQSAGRSRAIPCLNKARRKAESGRPRQIPAHSRRRFAIAACQPFFPGTSAASIDSTTGHPAWSSATIMESSAGLESASDDLSQMKTLFVFRRWREHATKDQLSQWVSESRP